MPLQPTKEQYSLPILQWTNAKGFHTYQVTPEDRLTLIRSVWREGRPQSAVAFTLLQRFTYLYPTYTNLSKFIRAYSQPINPRWFPTGDKYQAIIASLKEKPQTQEIRDKISRLEQKAKRRPIYATTPESQIPRGIIDIVDNVLSGRIKSPVPTAIHFRGSQATSSDSQETAKSKADIFALKGFGQVVPISQGYGPGLNWFFTGSEPTPKHFAMHFTKADVPTISPLSPSVQKIAETRAQQIKPFLPAALWAFGFALKWLSK